MPTAHGYQALRLRWEDPWSSLIIPVQLRDEICSCSPCYLLFRIFLFWSPARFRDLHDGSEAVSIVDIRGSFRAILQLRWWCEIRTLRTKGPSQLRFELL